ncbi:MAG: class I SAM-dependent methyltransferase [Alphaproteobacteria bacterium]|nr:class I SAM-dependent methyltransferase [Alphaproteobacteria bacterium]
MDAALFDKRRYPVVGAAAGYGEWAESYEATVAVGLDTPLLEALTSIRWDDVGSAADLACGTGRTGAWLAAHGVRAIDGVDITPQMLAGAAAKRVFRLLQVGDVAATPLPTAAYQLCTMVLADEHLAELGPVYREAARLLVGGGHFMLLGYHPFFLMNGLPTHYHRAGGEAITIRSYVHLFSEHHDAARACGLSLVEFRECVIDEAWLKTKPKWRPFLNWPVSFVLVWRRDAG